MNALLHSHLGIGYVLVLASLVAIFYVPARRIVLYVLILQIIVGAALWYVGGAAPPLAHWILAILNGGVYAVSSAMEKRGRKPLALTFAIVGFVIFAVVFGLGQHAVQST